MKKSFHGLIFEILGFVIGILTLGIHVVNIRNGTFDLVSSTDWAFLLSSLFCVVICCKEIYNYTE